MIPVTAALFLLTACGPDYGNEIHGGNLTVYFTDAKDESSAEKVALFWKENDLLTNKAQDLQLVRENGILRLKLIAFEPESATSMPFKERKALLDLQEEVREHLKEPALELVICDEEFEIVYNINE